MSSEQQQHEQQHKVEMRAHADVHRKSRPPFVMCEGDKGEGRAKADEGEGDAGMESKALEAKAKAMEARAKAKEEAKGFILTCFIFHSFIHSQHTNTYNANSST